MRLSHSLTCAVLAASATAAAQSFDYSLDAASSALTLDADVTLSLSGNLRGAYDATLNPAGTRTILGLFGDDGLNAEAPVTIDLDILIALGGALDGTFQADLNAGLGTVLVSNLAATVGAGGSSSADLTVTLNFDTFRTVNPSSAYIGGFPLSLPLGTATIANVVLAQSGPGAGTAVPGAAPGAFDLSAGVPADVSFDLDLSALGGAVTPVGPLPIVLPVTGSVDLADCETALLGTAGDAFMQSIPNPFPLDLTDVPLPLPTILPPGSTADLLLTASLDSLDLDGTLTGQLAASADAAGRADAYCASNVNSSGFAGELALQGSTSVMAEDLSLVATSLPTQSLGYMLMSRDADLVPLFGGSQGNLCLGGTLYRFSLSVQSSGTLGEVTFTPDFAALPGGQQFAAADSWNFQYWFRDANPTPTSNTTGALRVLFCR
ncbi:MAG: hypothetical protein AAGG01_07230 [Planctomycetota bacterium]